MITTIIVVIITLTITITTMIKANKYNNINDFKLTRTTLIKLTIRIISTRLSWKISHQVSRGGRRSRDYGKELKT